MRFLLFVAMAAALSLSLLAPAPASAAADTHRVAHAADGRSLDTASWHGRPIRQPHEHTATSAAADRTATSIRRGTGYRTPGGSQRVRTIQRRLRQLGYRPGPVDGKLGPRTEAALRWFEYKHGHASGEAITVGTLVHLRDRVTGATATDQPAAAPAPAPERTVTPSRPQAPAPDAGEDIARQRVDDTLVSAILVAVGLLGAAAFVAGFAQARAHARPAGPAGHAGHAGPAGQAGPADPAASTTPRPTTHAPPTRSNEEIRS